MRFDIYGRYEVVRAGPVIPAHLREGEVATYRDDVLHEPARPGDEIRRLD